MLKTIKNFVFSFAFLAILLLALIWLAIFSYVSIYYSYIPVLHFKKPVHLLRNPCERNIFISNEDRESCGSLSSTVNFIDGHFQPGVDYAIYIELEVPESHTNCMIGMFEVEIQMRSKEGNIIMISRRSTMLEYKSWLYKNLETFIYLPMYIFASRRQMQTLSVNMADDFQEDAYLRIYDAVVNVHHNKVQVYSSSLQVYAIFSGIRYFMYFWPMTAATFGISTLFGSLLLVVLVSCLTHFRFRTNRI